MILHITDEQTWAAAKAAGEYRADSLASEGFIHCSTPEQYIFVANKFYRGRTDLLVLEIKPDLLKAPLLYEEGVPREPGQLFPHLYGPLNLDAVTAVREFLPGQDGLFG